MFKRVKIMTFFFILGFFLQSCASSPKNAISKIQVKQAPPAGWYWDESRKALAYGGSDNSLKTKEITRGKPPSPIKEVTPPNLKVPSLPAVPTGPMARKEYIKSRFPGKRVIFPDELKIPAKKPDYRVGVDDVLHILVWNHPDLSVPDIVVRKDGAISLPLVGNIRAEGLTIPELEETLMQKLARFIAKPQVTVNPKEMSSQRIFLVGRIKKPSVTTGPLLPAYLLRGGNTLLEALSDVEFYPDADLPASYIARRDIIIPVDIKALLMDGDLTQNVLLEPGDRIVVPGPMKEINVLGEVKNPSKYKVKMDTTLLDALSIANGVQTEKADLYMAYVARNKQILPVNLKRLLDFGDMSQNMVMEDGDIVYVPNIDEKKYYVLGEVAKPGVVYFKDPVDIIEAIAQGGGFLTTGQREQVVVVRGDLRSPQLYSIDMLAMMEGRSFARFTLQKGDIVYVPRTLIADWNVFITQLFPTFQGIVLVDVLRR